MSEIQGTIRRLVSAPTDPYNDRNHAQNHVVEAVNAEKQLLKLIQSKGLLHIDVQELYRKARCTYEKIILNDHELAELQDIEYSLWKLHYKHIDEYRNRIRGSSVTKDRLNLAAVQNGASMLKKGDNYLEGFKSFLSEATEFYHHLIKKIRRSYGLPEKLLFFNEAGFSSAMDTTRMHRCQFSCHRCLVCLGDLARYRELYGNPDGQNRNWSVAATHYLNASTIWPDSGNPHNQLAVLAIYVGDELLALYHCIRSLAVKEPFPDAWDNLILLFEKNRSSHLHSLSNMAAFNFFNPSERNTVQIKAQSSEKFLNCQSREATRDDLTARTELWPLIVRMISYFYVKPSSEDFPCIFGSIIRELEHLLVLDDVRLKIAMESYQHMDVAKSGPFRVLQLVSVLIFIIHMPSETSKLQKAKHIKYMQQPSLIQQAFTTSFIFMGRLVHRCMMANPEDGSPLLPAILVFVEWLVDMFDRAEKYVTDEKCASAVGYFFDAFVDLLNQFDDEGSETESSDFRILWEDKELQGFSPISQLHGSLNLQNHQEARNGFEDRNEWQVRIHRIFVAAIKIGNKSFGSQKWIFYEETGRKFFTLKSKNLPARRVSVTEEAGFDFKVRKLEQQHSVSKDALPLQEVMKSCEVPPSEEDEKRLDVHESFPVEEEEEVILFKPLTRYNSAPLYLPTGTGCKASSEGESNLVAPSGECSHRGFSLHLPKEEICIPINSCSNITGSSNETFWQEPIPEDSVMDSFTEETDSPRYRVLSAKSGDPPSLAGPPSLNAWVVNRDNLGIAGGKGLKDPSKQGPEANIASAYLTSLSITGTDTGQQDVQVPSSSPASHLMYGSSYDGDPVMVHPNSSATSHHMESPYMPPVPSAPLLPDDATWFNGNSSYYAEDNNLPFTAQVNSYSNSTVTKHPLNFEPNVPRFSDVNTAYSGRFNYDQLLHQYQVHLDQAHDIFPRIQSYAPPTLGRFLDRDVLTVAPFDQSANPLASHQMKRLEDLTLYPGLITSADEQKNEFLFPAFPGPSRYGYGAVKELRSEQQLLLKYLKEKEWFLQQEAQLRGSA